MTRKPVGNLAYKRLKAKEQRHWMLAKMQKIVQSAKRLLEKFLD